MTKKAETSESKEIVNWEKRLQEEAKAVAKTERPSANKIYFTSGIMSYMDQAMPNNEIDCIILDHCAEHVFYREKYKQGEVTPPECFALGESGSPLFPHEAVPEPVNDNCTHCKFFKFESALDGGRGKACAERRRLAVIPIAEDLHNTEMAMMSIPVMSVRNWANYVNKVAATLQRPPWGVVTKVKVVPDKRSQFRVTFDSVGVLNSDQLGAIAPRRDLAQAMLYTPYEMAPAEPAPAEAEGSAKF